MSQNPSDKPELPQLPDFPSGDADPVPAGPPPVDPDPEPEPFEPDGGGSGGGDSRLPLVLGGLAALLLIGGGIWWLVGRDGGGRSPDEVVMDYLAATQDGDCDKLITLVTEEVWSSGGEVDRDEALQQCEDEVGSTEEMDLEIGKVETTSEKGEDATVDAEITIAGRSTTLPIDLRKVDGKWLIDGM